MKLKFTLFITLNLLFTVAFAQWNVTTIGTLPAKAFDVEVADGRNDGTQQVFVSTRNDGVYEFIYDSNSDQWIRATLYNGASQANLIQIEVGACRNDGINRVYSVEWNHNGGRIYESTWNGTMWNTITIATETDGITEIMIDDGRNDGVNRLYIGGYAEVGFNEYTWDGTNWQRIHLFSYGMEGCGFVGDAKGEGLNTVYSTGQYLLEFSWNGTSYDSTAITTSFMWPDPFGLGDTRTDGFDRIYANTNNGRQEVSYNSSTQTWDLFTISNDAQRGDVCLAKLKADGLNAIYSTFTSSAYNGTLAKDLIEFKWNSTSYDSTKVVDASTGATAMLNAGVGRTDDTMRLYAPNYEGKSVYEITWADPYVLPTTNIANIVFNDIDFNILQTNSKIELVFSKATEEEYMLDLVSINGKVVIQKQLPKGQNSTIINGLRKGVYIIRISSKTNSVSKKLILL